MKKQKLVPLFTLHLSGISRRKNVSADNQPVKHRLLRQEPKECVACHGSGHCLKPGWPQMSKWEDPKNHFPNGRVDGG